VEPLLYSGGLTFLEKSSWLHVCSLLLFLILLSRVFRLGFRSTRLIQVYPNIAELPRSLSFHTSSQAQIMHLSLNGTASQPEMSLTEMHDLCLGRGVKRKAPREFGDVWIDLDETGAPEPEPENATEQNEEEQEGGDSADASANPISFFSFESSVEEQKEIEKQKEKEKKEKEV
jgi:hypothetical protein